MLLHRMHCDVPNKSSTGAWLFTGGNRPCLQCHDRWWAKGHDSQRVNLFHLLLTTGQALQAGLLPGECGPTFAGVGCCSKGAPQKALQSSTVWWLIPVVKQAVNSQQKMNLKGRHKDGVQPLRKSQSAHCEGCHELYMLFWFGLMKLLEST